jgi:pilus assembly protein Flp/PilA
MFDRLWQGLEKRGLTRTSGQGLSEYVLILVLIAVVVLIILSLAGRGVSDMFSNVTSALGG